MQTEQLKDLVIDALEDRKAVNVICLEVKEVSSVSDYMVIASGTSRRHVSSIAENVIMKAKKQGMLPLGTEGEDAAEWVLVDLGDVIVNVMMPDTRAFYDLEKLWQEFPQAEEQDQDS